MDIEKLKNFLEEHNQPEFRLKQIAKAVYQDGVSSFAEITTLPKSLEPEMSKLRILSFEVEKILEASDGQAAKASLRLGDGNIIETVLLWPARNADAGKAGKSVCVSTQAGCPMNCSFCATGRGGFKRNLTAEEITDQVLFWRQYLNKNPSPTLPFKKGENLISNVVYMGMGEPFLNWENTKKSLQDLIDPQKFGFGSRSISVSTSGIPEGIIDFAKEFPQMNLALSLHFADNEKRSRFMPVNRQYDLVEIKKALQAYFKITKRKVFMEYIMLAGINDSREDAEKLAQYLNEIGETKLLHVNLIRYNSSNVIARSEATRQSQDLSQEERDCHGRPEHAGLPRNDIYRASSKNKTEEFKKYLLRNKINATIRKSLGEEIQGACGQLAGK